MPNKMPQAPMPAAQAQMPQILAQPGHQADLQLINTLVEQLAAVQTSNRLEMDQMMKEIKDLKLEKTNPETSQPTNTASQVPKTSMELQRMSVELQEANMRVTQLEEIISEAESTAGDYQDVMASIMIKVRDFAHQHHQASLSYHAYFASRMQALRDENLQLRLEHSSWQEHLGMAMEYARKALEAQTEQEKPLRAKIAGQARQIEVMRRMLGWEEFGDLDSENDDVPDQ